MIGTTLGHYRILERIGVGGMGEVYRARDLELGREVALKLLPPDLAGDPERVRRLIHEARAVAALNHPNIVTIHSTEAVGDRRFLTMELVAGEPLDRLIGPGGLPAERWLAIATPLAAALAAAHAVGVVHRDLKPSNVVVTGDGRPKLLDFGLARLMPSGTGPVSSRLETVPAMTRPGEVLGTLPYMSPEQVQGLPLDARSDVFSFGAMLYEMATGERPHRGGTDAALISAILRDAAPPVTGRRPDLPADLDRILGRCLEKDPSRRYQTSLDVFNELDALRHAARSGAPAPAEGPAAPASDARRRRLFVGLSALAVAAVALVGGLQARSGCAPTDAGASVAVLPFANVGGDPETHYLSDGVTAGVINRLAEFSGLKVMSRLSVERFKDGVEDPRSAGRLLGVASVLTGRLEVRGERLVVDAELLDVKDGRHLWGDRFERARQDIPNIEREIVSRISERLRVRLGGGPSARQERDRTLDPVAYDLYLRGRYVMRGTSDDGPARAQEFFRQAIEREPRLAIAHAGLGESYVNQAWLSSKARDEAVPLAKAALARALELDSELCETHVLAGDVALYFEWDWAAAEAAYRRAIELKPGSDLAHREYANFLSLVDRVDEGIAEARTAQSLDPLSTAATHQLGYNLLMAGRYEAAAAEFRKAIDLNPTWLWGNIKLGMTLARMGARAPALAAVARADELLAGAPGSPLAQSWLAQTAWLCGERERARETIARLEREARSTYVDPVALAELHYVMGDLERAFASMERGYAVRSPLMVYAQQLRRVMWNAAADDPRYRGLIERLRFPRGPA